MRREAIPGSHLLYFSLDLHDELTLSASESGPVMLLSRRTGRVLKPRGHPPAPGAIFHVEPQEIIEHRLPERQSERERAAAARILQGVTSPGSLRWERAST